MKSSTLEVFIIILILIIQFCIINPIEKVILYTPNNVDRRPVCLKNEVIMDYSFKCMGTPSGHMETLTIALFLFYAYYKNSNKYKILLTSLSLIIMMACERMYSERHNLYQVCFGTLLGIVYGIIYVQNFDINPLFICVFIVILLTILYFIKYSYIVDNQQIPDWVDKDLYYIQKNKTKNSTMKYIDLLATLSKPDIIYNTWNNFEKQMDDLVKTIDMIKIDIIIGIKSGGAFISNYIGKKYNKPYTYIKIKAKNIDSHSDFSKTLKYITTSNIYKDGYDVLEKPNIDVNGKNILLVDETVRTGNTVAAAKDYLTSLGSASITTAFIQDIQKSDFDYNIGIWPWGYDNFKNLLGTNSNL